MKTLNFAFILALSILTSAGAFAGESMFGRVYTTETVPAKHYEWEELIRTRTGRATGRYTAFDSRTEFEYGVTDDFQVALYLNSSLLRATNSPDDDDIDPANGRTTFSRNNFSLSSISTEFIYRILSPISDPIGLALYMEPEFMFHDIHNGMAYDHSMEIEYRILVQKNFFEDQLVLAYNLVAELEFLKFDGGDYKSELDWNHEFGASYRVASRWYAGLEARNHNELGEYRLHEHSVIWAGPTIHYAVPSFWLTLGILKQIWGGSNAVNGIDPNGQYVGNNLFLRSHENWEITLKAALPF